MEGGVDDMDSYTRLRIRLAVAHAEAVKEGDEPKKLPTEQKLERVCLCTTPYGRDFRQRAEHAKSVKLTLFRQVSPTVSAGKLCGILRNITYRIELSRSAPIGCVSEMGRKCEKLRLA